VSNRKYVYYVEWEQDFDITVFDSLEQAAKELVVDLDWIAENTTNFVTEMGNRERVREVLRENGYIVEDVLYAFYVHEYEVLLAIARVIEGDTRR